MKNFKHFIITQFNIPLWDKDKANKPTCTDEWLEKRFILFEKYCFPSIESQTNKNFLWLCLFDKNTPETYLKKIREYENRLPQFKACYMTREETKEKTSTLQKIISTYTNSEDTHIITTNIDNDDSIHSEMVAHIQKNIKISEEDTLYSFPYGYQYFIKMNLLIKMEYPHNHFLTLVEKNTDKLQTIVSIRHAIARKVYKTIDFKTLPYWIEYVHDNNVNNDMRITSRIKYFPVFYKVDFKDFGVELNYNTRVNTVHTLTKLPAYFLKTGYKKLKRKINKPVED